jgi:hypothetical protein
MSAASRWDIERAILRSDLPHPARLVALALLTHTTAGTGTVPPEHSPSLAKLAAQTGLARWTVERQLVILERAGWVKRRRSRKAAREHVPTQYELRCPAPDNPPRARHTVSLGSEDSQGARHSASPGLGTESGKARHSASPYQTNRPVTDHPPGRAGAARVPAKADPAADANTQQTLAAFIDWDRANGGELTRSTIGQLARHIRDLLAEGVEDIHIRQALVAWRVSNRTHPSTLHSFVDEVRAGPKVSARQSERDAMFDRAMARAQTRKAARAAGGELPWTPPTP